MISKNISTSVVMLAALVGLVTIIGIVIYTAQNQSGHTGVNPYMALVVFVPVTVIGIMFTKDSGAPGWTSILAMVIGIAGILLLIYLNRSNTLLQYDVWIQRGMP